MTLSKDELLQNCRSPTKSAVPCLVLQLCVQGCLVGRCRISILPHVHKRQPDVAQQPRPLGARSRRQSIKGHAVRLDGGRVAALLKVHVADIDTQPGRCACVCVLAVAGDSLLRARHLHWHTFIG